MPIRALIQGRIHESIQGVKVANCWINKRTWNDSLLGFEITPIILQEYGLITLNITQEDQNVLYPNARFKPSLKDIQSFLQSHDSFFYPNITWIWKSIFPPKIKLFLEGEIKCLTDRG